MNRPYFSSPRATLTFMHKSIQDRYFDLDVGRNKTARRQQGWAFPAIGAPETPVLRLTRGQAYSGLRRDVYNDERAARGRSQGALRRAYAQYLAYTGRSASCTAFPRNAWERGVNMSHWLPIPIMAMLLCLSACTPTRVDNPMNLITPPKDWHQPPYAQTQSNPADLKEWWKGFQDPTLNALIDQALANNHDLRSAVARVREAKAMTTVADSALYPSIDLYASGGREKKIDRIIGVPNNQGIGLFTPTADMITGGLSARWEIDLFGARQLEAEAASAQAEGAEQALHAAQAGLLAQVATHYLELRGVQQRTAILQKNINIQQERLRVLKAFIRTGLANQWDVARQETLANTTAAALPTLKSAASNLINRLAVLLGEPPENMQNRLAHAEPLPANSPGIPRLLPSALLEQRPDLRLAQTEVAAMAARLGAARADLLPKLVLSASGGFGALDSSGFSSLAETVYTLGSGLTAPIFNAGRIQAHITAFDARLDQVAANYEKTFLLALEDVENAYVAHVSSLERRDRMTEAETSAEEAYRLANGLYRHGANDYLSVLDAQRTQLVVADERAKAETAVHVALVSIYRAFGGGWIAEAAH